MKHAWFGVGLAAVIVAGCGDDSGGGGSGGGTTSGNTTGSATTGATSSTGATTGATTTSSTTTSSTTTSSTTGSGGATGSGGGGTGGGGSADRILVPGGSFHRQNNPALPATVSEFYLDRHEVTVAQFRTYVASIGDAERTVLLARLAGCAGTTWTDAPGANENKPINCLLRAEGPAVCEVLGGRLPTELEWNYAAAGGEEERFYPWSEPADDATIDATRAVYQNDTEIQDVGTKPAGAGRWGHLDLAGNVWEMTADSDNQLYVTQETCDDCSFTDQVSEPRYMRRGGGYDSGPDRLQNDDRDGDSDDGQPDIGVRCAYDGP